MSDDSDFRQFIEVTSGRPGWPALVRAAELVGGGDALDLGCGAGRDTEHLLRQGFRVTAVDASPWARAAMRRMPHQRQLEFIQSTIDDFQLGTYDLINAQLVLPFLSSDQFHACIPRLIAALRPAGALAATFFGPRDDWNVPGAKLTFVTRTALEGLLADLDVVALDEEEREVEVADGTRKHGHIFWVIARRAA